MAARNIIQNHSQIWCLIGGITENRCAVVVQYRNGSTCFIVSIKHFRKGVIVHKQNQIATALYVRGSAVCQRQHITELLDENGNTVAKINNEKGSLPQLLGNEYLFKRQPTETGMKLFYIFLNDITTGKELEWKMFEE